MDLAVNPNTVVRVYRELEIRGVLDTRQGAGTFIARKKLKQDERRTAGSLRSSPPSSWRATAAPDLPSRN